MLGENKNLKDSQDFVKDNIKDTSSVPAPYQAAGFGSVSHIKTNKLITALYMVTDIMDKEEPLRNKLRVLGSEMISDIHIIHHGHSGTHDAHSSKQTTNKISEILSFLDIASTIGMISEMNHGILKKEFIGLKLSLQEKFGQELSIAELFPILNEEGVGGGDLNYGGNHLNDDSKNKNTFSITKSIPPTRNVDKAEPTRIGVQKGSTLLGALNRIQMSDSKVSVSNKTPNPVKIKTSYQTSGNDFEVLKNKRRDEILRIVKDNKVSHPASGGATISDIRAGAKGVLVSCGEKTLQRELVSMVKDTVLKKTGEKRWSKYFI